MTECNQCGTEVVLPFTCAYCGGNYCVEHRLPESHRCPNTPKIPPPYLTPTVTKGKVPEDRTSKLGLCPQCYNCSDKIIEYDAKTITFQCGHCSFIFSQSKALPHNYVEQPEKPVPIEQLTPIMPPLKRRQFPLKKVVGFSIIAILAGVLVLSVYPNLLQSTLSPSTSPNPSTTPSVPSNTPPNTLPESLSHEELVNYALSLINSDRHSNGLQNVTLNNIDSGQRHADTLLQYNFLSHWDISGYKPYMRYTLAGGKGSVAENAAWLFNSGGLSPVKAIEKLEHNMMYDDASSNWGHRDNILDAFHNKVSIGIAYDSNNVYIVQDFEDDYISWSMLSLSNQVLMQGTILKAGESISQVAIYFDNPTPLTTQQLENPPYDGSYDSGTYVGLVVSTGWEAKEGITITATTWSQTGTNFEIAFDLSPAFAKYGKGVYTLYLWTDSSNILTSFSIWN